MSEPTEMVEVVIRIPKNIYEDLFNKELQDWFIESEVNFYGLKIGKAIQNGTVLPKGHGRLKAEPTEEDIAKTIGGQNDFADCIREAVKTVFANASTIIEADTESTESEKI